MLNNKAPENNKYFDWLRYFFAFVKTNAEAKNAAIYNTNEEAKGAATLMQG